MQPIKVILLKDHRPGHYHVSEGVVAALKRVADVECTRVEIKRRKLVPNRLMRAALKRGASSELLIGLGYGFRVSDLPKADLVVSSGGETLVANIAVARLLGAENIFCGSLRRIPPTEFSLVLTSYDRLENEPRHAIVLKPNTMDPVSLGRGGELARLSAENPPKLMGCLIGGNSGMFSFTDNEWRELAKKLREISIAFGTRWLISTSRRTGDIAGDIFAELARDRNVVEDFIDYRTAGPGTLPEILKRADAILCTADSSSMVSEAVSARQPVIGLRPEVFDYKSEEAEYLDFMTARNWCRFMGLEMFDAQSFMAALQEITPMSHNHLDVLAKVLMDKLPDLFAARSQRSL